MAKNPATSGQSAHATSIEQPIILIRGFGGLGVEDEKKIAYQALTMARSILRNAERITSFSRTASPTKCSARAILNDGLGGHVGHDLVVKIGSATALL
jgi:hypothetical protein